MAAGRRFWFSPDGTAALSYRVLNGYAVVAGDPIGNPGLYTALVSSFAEMCREHHWHVAVLGVSEPRLALWHSASSIVPRLATVPIGRDVVIDVDGFSLAGRRKRNLRQAVQRTHNAGMTTQVVAENQVDDQLRAELRGVMLDSGKSADKERGFSMMLGGTLSGCYPGYGSSSPATGAAEYRASIAMPAPAEAPTSAWTFRGVAGTPRTARTSGSAST